MTHLLSAEAGTATIDVSLSAPLRSGGSVEATVELRGGTRDEVLEGLGLEYQIRDGGTPIDCSVRSPRSIADQVRIPAGEHRTVATTIGVPEVVPASLGDTTIAVGLNALPADFRTGRTESRFSSPESRLSRPESPVATVSGSRGTSEPVESGSRGTPKPARSTDEADRPPVEPSLATDGGSVRTAGSPDLEFGPSRSVEIRPGDRLSNVLDAMSALGFFLESAAPLPAAEDETGSSGTEPTSPVQVLEFRPRWGPYADMGALVCYLTPGSDRLEVEIRLGDGDSGQVAEQMRQIAGCEPQTRLTVRDTDRYAVRADLEALLERL